MSQEKLFRFHGKTYEIDEQGNIVKLVTGAAVAKT